MCCRSRHKPKIDIVLVKSSQFDELIAAEGHPGASSGGAAPSEAAPEPPIPAGPVPDGPATFVTESTSSHGDCDSPRDIRQDSLDDPQDEVTVTLEGQDGSRIGPIHISQAPSRGRPVAPPGHIRPAGSS